MTDKERLKRFIGELAHTLNGSGSSTDVFGRNEISYSGDDVLTAIVGNSHI
jgi:hypothetical protein